MYLFFTRTFFSFLVKKNQCASQIRIVANLSFIILALNFFVWQEEGYSITLTYHFISKPYRIFKENHKFVDQLYFISKNINLKKIELANFLRRMNIIVKKIYITNSPIRLRIL